MSCLEDITGSSNDDALDGLASMPLPDYPHSVSRNAKAVGTCVVTPITITEYHNAANEYLGLIERAENGAPRACANWTAPSSGQ
jgi:hypothetical protein